MTQRKRFIPSRARRAFTILEVVLAATLASMMLILCFALMAAMSRSQQRLAGRVDQSMELATAHRALSRAFSNLLMTDQPEPNEEQIDKLKQEDLKASKDEKSSNISFDPRSARLSIQPDLDAPKVDNRPVQIVSITLRTPPIFGGDTEIASEFVRTNSKASRAGSSSSDSSSRNGLNSSLNSGNSIAGNSSSSGSQGSLTTAMGLANRAAGGNANFGNLGNQGTSGNGPDAPQLDSSGLTPTSSPLNASALEPARAQGVRGLFELLPDEFDPKHPAPGRVAGEPALSLWWSELPAEASAPPPGTTLTDKQKAAELNSTRELRHVKLLSNLRNARWTVFRGGDFYPKMSATFASLLPAYVQFQFETMEGRREDWVFEVSWTLGAEPGSPVPVATDQFNQLRGADQGGNPAPTPIPVPAGPATGG